MTDVLVIGGGPAGMAAAGAALAAGASVRLVDGGLRLGGQLWRQPVVDGSSGPVPGPPLAPGLPARFRRLDGQRLELDLGRAVWSLEREDAFAAHLEGGETRSARALVLATGASELLLPFLGWELPGVVSAGAAQALLKAQRQLIGRRVVVGGSGPFLLPVSAGLAAAGAQVRAVVEARPLHELVVLAPALLRAPRKLAEAASYSAALARRGVPVRYGRAVVACEGDEVVRQAVVARVGADWRPLPGTEERIEVDAVCVSFGFVPRVELARQLGAGELSSEQDPVVTVACDAEMATSVPGVFVAGELAGVAGGEVAELEGAIAGRAAAAFCGYEAARPVAPIALVRRLGRARRFAAALQGAYRPVAGLSWADDATVVCRCEDVTAGAVRAAIAAGAQTVRELRGQTRCGMGYCQGRTCGPVLQLALGATTGQLGAVGDLHRRPVATPVPLGEVASSTPG